MKYVGFIVFVVIFQAGWAQGTDEIPFIQHLVNKGYYKEAAYLIAHDTLKYNAQQSDSINYYNGWALYSLKELERSTQSLLKVGKESPFYLKSHFFAGYNQIYLGNYTQAQTIFEAMNIRNEPNLSLVNFEQCGIRLLQGNWKEGAEMLKLVNRDNAFINQQAKALEEISREHQRHRAKSPVVAGIMSGIIPGSGKIYAGETGAGIASMIGTIGFGLITRENYHKRGIANAKTIIFGGLFLVNYVSNIYGSVVSVKVIEAGYENTLHNQILFQLHIPLRNFFE